jgi:hypothetical protein
MKEVRAMIDSDAIKEYISWVDEANSKAELIDTLKDIREDLLRDDDADNEGGKQYSLRK